MGATAINSVIDNLAAKLAIPTEAILATLPSMAITMLVCFALELIGTVVLAMVAFKSIRKARTAKNMDDEFSFMMLGLFSGITSAILSVLVMSNIPDVVLCLCDQKAWSIHYLFKLIK